MQLAKHAMLSVCAIALLACSIAPQASAVSPKRWTHATEADFEPGVVEGTIVTNLGDITLAPSTTPEVDLPEDVTVIHDFIEINRSTYLAVGPTPRVIGVPIMADNVTIDFPDEPVFALSQWHDELIVGISGPNARLTVLTSPEENITLASFPESVQYIWDIAPATHNGKPSLLVATGPEGQLFAVTPGDEPAEVEPELIYDAEQANLLTLATSDTQDHHPVYFGSDTDGLLYRIQTPGETPFVVYDAAEPEISVIKIASNGNVYFGTADADQARPGRLEEAATEETGRPETDEPNTADAASTEQASSPQDAAQEPTDVSAESDTPSTEAADAVDASAESDDQATDTDPTPTPEQRDRLRELVRQRLLAARASGTLQAPASGRSTSGRSARPAASAASAGSKEGNAVYQLTSDGFVSEVFRESVMVLDLIPHDDQLIVATGPEGQLYKVDPTAGETAIVIDLDVEHITRLLVVDGILALATANPASVQIIDHKEGDLQGNFTSAILDAAHISLWGAMHITASLPENTSVLVETRSGNVIDPQTAPWSPWQTAGTLTDAPASSEFAPRPIAVPSPPARYFQYRLTLNAPSFDQDLPSITKVEQTYITPNLAPKIESFMAAYPEASPPQPGEPAEPPVTLMDLNWEATDFNQDRLTYTLTYRPADSKTFIEVIADHPDNSYQWETRQVPDGYYLLRVTASDSLDNPPDMARTTARLSNPVLVDNTPPAVAVKHTPDTLNITVADTLSPIAALSYAVDSADTYQPVLPDDLIADSTTETFSIKLPGSTQPGVITLRATDTRGNTTHHALNLH